MLEIINQIKTYSRAIAIHFCLAFLLFSQVKCSSSSCDCRGSIPFSFIIEGENGESLFGESDVYKPLQSDSLEVFAYAENGDSLAMGLFQNGEILLLFFDPDFTQYTLEYSFATKDRLEFDFVFIDDPSCCGPEIEGYFVSINGDVFKKGELGTTFTLTK